MMNPGGTGNPARTRRVRLAPLPPALASVASASCSVNTVASKFMFMLLGVSGDNQVRPWGVVRRPPFQVGPGAACAGAGGVALAGKAAAAGCEGLSSTGGVEASSVGAAMTPCRKMSSASSRLPRSPEIKGAWLRRVMVK